jgi:hypothetical protein
MKTIKSFNNDSEFRVLGKCVYGGISKEEILNQLINKDLVTEDTIPMIKNRSFITHPVQNELILITTSIGLLNIKDDNKYINYQTIVNKALGSVVELDGIKYIVSECPYEIAAHATLGYQRLNEGALIQRNLFVTRESVKIDNNHFGLSLFLSRGNRAVGNTTDITKLSWYINDKHQFWHRGDIFIFCLKQK